jgi:hypothetical protein
MVTKGGKTVAPGQAWRSPSGDVLEVKSIDGSTVVVDVKSMTSLAISAGAEHIDSFDGCELLAQFRVVVSGRPADTIMKGLGRALVRYSAAGAPEPGEFGPPRYEATVMAVSISDAEALVSKAAGPHAKLVSTARA